MDVISEIKSRISIEELAGNYVKLMKAGRNFKALCPFHNEKTPSFFVSPEKQLAYCFGCNKGGDIFKFVQEIEHIDFPEALKILASKANVELPVKYEIKEKGKRDRFLSMHESAKEFFKKYLLETKEGEKVLSYLRKKRKLDEETISKFELGYAPLDASSLMHELLGKGYSRDEIAEAGLGMKSRISDAEIRDRFIQRLIFPIWDSQGQVVAFGGRALKDGQEPKYLNSPESLIYRKSSLLYGLHLAKESLRKDRKALLVEGYMDVIRCHEAGATNAVGVCGTSFTPEQARLIKRFAESIILFFDADEAGKTATLRASSIAGPEGLFVSVLRPHQGKDPDEWLAEKPKDFRKALESPPQFFDFLFEELSKTYDFKDPHQKQKAVSELLPFLIEVKSRIEQDAHIQKIALLLKVEPGFIYDEMSRRKIVPVLSRETFSASPSSSTTTEEYLIGCFIQYPETWSIANSRLNASFFTNEQNQLYKILEGIYNNNPTEKETVFNLIPDELQEKAKFLAFFAETQNFSLSFDEIYEGVEKGAVKFVREKLEARKKDLHKLIKEAEANRDHSALQRLLEEYQDISKPLSYAEKAQKIHFSSF